jgi:hypothetical protein
MQVRVPSNRGLDNERLDDDAEVNFRHKLISVKDGMRAGMTMQQACRFLNVDYQRVKRRLNADPK